MKNSMKHTVWIATGFVALLAAVPAGAQVARFDVPFSFLARGKVLPAGQYDVRTNTDCSIVSLASKDGTAAAFALIKPVRRSNGAGKSGALEFLRYGNVYVLKNVWTRNRADGYRLPTSSAERELARTNPPVQIASIPAVER